MTRRHFQAIADVLAGELALALADGSPADAQVTLRNLTASLADVCAAENPRFDRAKFYAASGFPKGPFSR
jgi:hypothetical protein